MPLTITAIRPKFVAAVLGIRITESAPTDAGVEQMPQKEQAHSAVFFNKRMGSGAPQGFQHTLQHFPALFAPGIHGNLIGPAERGLNRAHLH